MLPFTDPFRFLYFGKQQSSRTVCFLGIHIRFLTAFGLSHAAPFALASWCAERMLRSKWGLQGIKRGIVEMVDLIIVNKVRNINSLASRHSMLTSLLHFQSCRSRFPYGCILLFWSFAMDLCSCPDSHMTDSYLHVLPASTAILSPSACDGTTG